MTNETTASQPMQELVRDLYNFEGGRHFALRLEKMLASQPKSIGDDAQFQKLLSNLEVISPDRDDGPHMWKVYAACKLAFLDYLDSKLRDRAAQASATIQAGQWVRCTPNLINAGVNCGHTPRRPGDGTYSHDHFIAHSAATIQAAPETCTGCDNPAGPQTADSYGFCNDCMEFSGNIAATIQEPVMVAEPGLRNSAGARKHAERIDNMHKGVVSVFAAIKAEHDAAPMVADPAGVALEMTDAQIDNAICLVYATDYQDDSAAYDRAVVRAALASLAATVKAVPSEAPCMVVFNTDSQVKGCDWDNVPPGVYHVFAAPLADKTGGGE